MRRHLAVVMALMLAPASVRAADLGKEIERGLGGMVSQELESTYGVVDDPLLNDWVDGLGQRLATVSGRSNLKYRFRILNSDDVNAVAAPGGFVYVNRGTLRFVRSEDELASVLGHEVGHVAGRHAMKQVGAQIAGLLVMAGFQAAHAETLRTVGGLAGGLAMLKFSRDEENDADRRGLRNAVAAGYDGKAMPAFFQRLESIEKGKPSKLETYFLTHPPTDERLRRIAGEPGVADTAANALALGEGYERRGLYREAARAYQRALDLDPTNAEAKRRLPEALARAPERAVDHSLSAPARREAAGTLAGLAPALETARTAVAQDSAKLAGAEKDAGDELEAAARSLSTVSGLVRENTMQYREFIDVSRAFERATTANANLRAVQETADDTLGLVTRLQADMQAAVEGGDAAAAAQAQSMARLVPSALADVTAASRAARSRAGDARDGAQSLRQAATSLEESFRAPFGFTDGQYSILELHSSSADTALRDADAAARKALDQAARARVRTLAARIDFLTRAVPATDTATSTVVAHYLTVDPALVTAVRSRIGLGGAAVVIAADRMQNKKKGKAATGAADLAKIEPQDVLAKQNLRWDDAAVLLNLIANDLDRELSAAR